MTFVSDQPAMRRFFNSGPDRIVGTPKAVRAYARDVKHGQIAVLRADDPRVSAFTEQHFIELDENLVPLPPPEPVVPEVREVVEVPEKQLEPIVVFDYPVAVQVKPEDEEGEKGEDEKTEDESGDSTKDTPSEGSEPSDSSEEHHTARKRGAKQSPTE